MHQVKANQFYKNAVLKLSMPFHTYKPCHNQTLHQVWYAPGHLLLDLIHVKLFSMMCQRVQHQIVPSNKPGLQVMQVKKESFSYLKFSMQM